MHHRIVSCRPFSFGSSVLIGAIASALVACGGGKSDDDAGGAGGSGGESGAGGAGATMTGGSGGSGGSGGMAVVVKPLEQTLAQFCTGDGAVVAVGSGDICTGNLAERVFRFAVCACDTIEAGSNLSTDAYDASMGAYDPNNAAAISHQGHLGINNAFNGSVVMNIKGSLSVGNKGSAAYALELDKADTITQQLYANGNIRTTSGASTQVGIVNTATRDAFVNGNVEQTGSGDFNITGNLHIPSGMTYAAAAFDDWVGENPTPSAVVQEPVSIAPPCPCEPSEKFDIAGLTTWAADPAHNDNDEVNPSGMPPGFDKDRWATTDVGDTNVSFDCGRYYLTKIDQPGKDLTVTITGRAVLFVDGDFTAKGVTFTIDRTTHPNAQLDIFIKGGLTINSATTFGNLTYPSAVRTYVLGDVSLGASAVFAGNIYAPNANVTFNASATVYGSMFVNKVTFSGASQFHYDTAIRSAVDACESGNPPPPSQCTSCFDCEASGQACLNTGSCGPCVTDLDCCAPNVCTGGMCYPPVG